jgi:hypothetical protein
LIDLYLEKIKTLSNEMIESSVPRGGKQFSFIIRSSPHFSEHINEEDALSIWNEAFDRVSARPLTDRRPIESGRQENKAQELRWDNIFPV